MKIYVLKTIVSRDVVYRTSAFNVLQAIEFFSIIKKMSIKDLLDIFEVKELENKVY